MFDSLSGRLGEIFDRLTKRGALSERDVEEALRAVRVALLEADVALPVVRSFIDGVRERAVGERVIRSVTPAQMVVKIVHDRLVETLGAEPAPLAFSAPPSVAMLVGLQGSGKTTTTVKIARRLAARDRKKVLVASLDTRRPAAQEQLAQLARAAPDGVDCLPVVAGQPPEAIAARAARAASLGGYDVALLDTAGRMHVDEALMVELERVRAAVNPVETLLVADALTGQDAVNLARAFKERAAITGIVLTRVDGDGRGGAALSMRAATGCPVKLVGVGEALDALEDFHPERIASRILGMGDVVSLVEKAAENVEAEEAEAFARKLGKGRMDLDDLAAQLRQLRRMGGMDGVLGLLPGVGAARRELADARIDDGAVRRQEAIISSMTPGERRNPRLLNGSRKRRVAAGSGVTVPEVNRLLKQFRDMQAMMKRMKKQGKRGGRAALAGAMGLPGAAGAPPFPGGRFRLPAARRPAR